MGAAYGYGKGGMSAMVNYSSPGTAKPGYNNGRGIGADSLGAGAAAGFYGGNGGGYNNGLEAYKGGDQNEWGNKPEEAKEEDDSDSSEGGEANAKPPPSQYEEGKAEEEEHEDGGNQDKRSSTENGIKKMQKSYDGRDQGLASKMADYMGKQAGAIGNNLNWASQGDLTPGAIGGMGNDLKGKCQKAKNDVKGVGNKFNSKYKNTSKICGAMKGKMKELTKSNSFAFNYGGGGGGAGGGGGGGGGGSGGGGQGQGGGAGGGGGGAGRSGGGGGQGQGGGAGGGGGGGEGGGGSSSGGGSSGGGSSGGGGSEGFQEYCKKRMDKSGNDEFESTTSNIKGRSSCTCSSTKGAACGTPNRFLGENMSIIKNKSYYDFDLKIDLLFTQNSKGGVAFRMRDSFNYYAFYIDSIERTKSILKVTDGKVEVLKQIKDGGIVLDDWHSVHITATNSHIKVFIYDQETVDRKPSEKVLEAHDTFFIQGQVGIMTSNYDGFCFDKLQITGKKVWTPWKPKKIKLNTKTCGSFKEGNKLFFTLIFFILNFKNIFIN
jgi:hypothetical protein